MPYKPEYYDEGSFDDIYYLAENLVYVNMKTYDYDADDYLKAAINSLSNRIDYGDISLSDIEPHDYFYIKKRLLAMEQDAAFIECYMQNVDQYNTNLD